MELFFFFAFQLLMEVQSYNLPQAKLEASASVILETDTVQLSCENTKHLKMEMCVFNIYGRESNSKLSSSCQLSLTGSQIIKWSGGHSSSVRITCVYTVKESQQQKTSPLSDPVTVTVKSSTTTTTAHNTTTAMTTICMATSTLPGNRKAPAVKVSPDALRESSSVKMICETPADVTVEQCHFYINREQKNIKVSWSCELDLTGAEVLRWAAVKSPASVHINCFYTIHELGINKPSSHSPAATVTVLGSLQKPFISVSDNDVLIIISCEIPLSVRADFTCSFYTEDGRLYRSVSQRSQSGEHQCVFYSSHSELFTRSVNSRQLSCDYSLSTEREIRSPHSDTHTIRGSTTATTAHTTATTMKNSLTVRFTSETTTYSKTATTVAISITESPTSTRAVVSSVHTSAADPNDPLAPLYRDRFIVLVSTGVGVIVSGLICLCWFTCKKRRKHNKMRSITSDQGIGMSSGPAETYSLITSVPATSQPISVGLEHPESHQDSTPDPTATYSFIMSENSVYQPSEVLVNTQQKQGNTEENEIVYHLYCTIPDKPVHSNAVYSLVH